VPGAWESHSPVSLARAVRAYGRAVRRRVLLVLLYAGVLLFGWPAITGDPLLNDLHVVPLRRPFPPADVFTPPRAQPAAALSFRAVRAVAPRGFQASVQAQHLASLALYLFALALLLQFARARHPGDRVHPWHAFALGAFALHPSLVESFGHLSARGEALALAALAALALSLQRGRAALGLGAALVALAASPVAAPAAVALALAAALDAPSPRARRTAAAVALAAALFAAAARPSAADLARWASRVPGAVSVATRALIVPTETALRLPQWELSLALTPASALTAALPLLAAVFLWRRGAPRLPGVPVPVATAAPGARSPVPAVLLAGATLSALPLVARADTLEFGLDRYLSAAALLLAVALLRAPAPAWVATLSAGTRRLVGASGVALLLLLGFMSWQTARGFRSDAHQLDAMMQMRPRDPSGHLRNAWFAVLTGDRVTARRSLRSARRGQLTPTMARVARAIGVRLGEP